MSTPEEVEWVRYEYLVTWRRKDGRKRRKVSQAELTSEDRYNRLVGESEGCTCYKMSCDPSTPGYSCIDREEKEMDMCSPCAEDFATEVILSRREVGEWEEVPE